MLDRYLGKIVSVIRQEGFFVAIKKLFWVARSMSRPVGSGDVLFVSSGIVGDSWRYRVKNVAEELELHGFKCASVIQEYPGLAACADKFSIFIFHKATNTPKIQKFIESIKEKNKEIIFETDDLLFDAKYIQQQDFFRNANPAEKRFFENGIGGEILADPYVKTCTTTTSFLAEKLRGRGKQVFVVPNKLSKKDIEIAERINSEKIHNDSNRISIGYFSGALSHNKDFATITGVLARLMKKYENIKLMLAGPLDTESALNEFSDRIKQLPYVPREKHFENIARVDINIAPLEIGNPFCEAKSELKFFEAGVMDVPTVAAATAPFQEAIEDGLDSFVANGDEEWFGKLERLIVNKKLRESMGEKAHLKAIEKYSVGKSNNAEYYAYLKNKIK